MRKKKRKKLAEQQLLDSIFALESEWKHIQQIVEQSIEPSENSLNHLRLAQAKYMFLLGEARHKNLSALS
ncbi:MAG TPA: YaaL family protein [Bacillota bacterium]|nr:YaaL family protein [Bacillota bacterium]